MSGASIIRSLGRKLSSSTMSPSDDRLEKRRAVNRQSQRRARAQKEEHIRNLERTNSVLEDEVRSLKDRLRGLGDSAVALFSPSPSTSDGLNRIRGSISSATAPSLPTSHDLQGSNSISTTTQSHSQGPPAASVDLEACRQAFLAVLASVCDPHLNTIHAVAQKFAASRNPRVSNPTASLNRPRPVNRPLNQGNLNQQSNDRSGPATLTYDNMGQSHQHQHQHDRPGPSHLTYENLGQINQPGRPGTSSSQQYGNYGSLPSATERPDYFNHHLQPVPDNITAFLNSAFPSLPPTSYVSPLQNEGPLEVPFFEPSHPIDGFELDADGVWSHVLLSVDMTKVDAEDLAGKLVDRIHCYGFGPVLLRKDVTEVCQSEFPSLALK